MIKYSSRTLAGLAMEHAHACAPDASSLSLGAQALISNYRLEFTGRHESADDYTWCAQTGLASGMSSLPVICSSRCNAWQGTSLIVALPGL
jgi:hypothetical protein